MIRKLTIHDLYGIMPLIEKQAARYPDLKLNSEKARAMVADCASNAQNFGLVSVDDTGAIVGVLGALSYDNLWAHKRLSSVMIWVCEKTGDGITMLRQYLSWLESRPIIMRGGFQFDLEMDDRVIRIIQRLGFVRHGGCYLKLKGA